MTLRRALPALLICLAATPAVAKNLTGKVTLRGEQLVIGDEEVVADSPEIQRSLRALVGRDVVVEVRRSRIPFVNLAMDRRVTRIVEPDLYAGSGLVLRDPTGQPFLYERGTSHHLEPGPLRELLTRLDRRRVDFVLAREKWTQRGYLESHLVQIEDQGLAGERRRVEGVVTWDAVGGRFVLVSDGVALEYESDLQRRPIPPFSLLEGAKVEVEGIVAPIATATYARPTVFIERALSLRPQTLSGSPGEGLTLPGPDGPVALRAPGALHGDERLLERSRGQASLIPLLRSLPRNIVVAVEGIGLLDDRGRLTDMIVLRMHITDAQGREWGVQGLVEDEHLLKEETGILHALPGWRSKPRKR